MGKVFFNIGKATPDVVVSSDGLRDPLRVRTTQALGGFGALPPYFLLRDTDGVRTADADEIRAEMASVGTVSSVMPLRLKRPTDGVTEWFTFPLEPLVSVSGRNEIVRRYFKALCDLKNGAQIQSEVYKLELLMNQAGLTMGAREVEKQAHARSEATGGAPAAAIELSDGTVITGKTGPLLGATASALINALKYLAGIPQETDLVSAAAIEPIQTLKTNYLGGKNPRLHTDEILIALSSSAASSELAAAAMHQLPNLKGCDVHSTVLLSSVDSSTLNRLGMYLTCDPVYEEEDRKYHKL